MDGYPCTCGGENCNCFRCDGTGIVEKSLPAIGRPHRNFAQAVHEVAAKQARVINNPPDNQIERNKGTYSRWSLVPKEFPTEPKTSNIISKKLKIALKEWLGSPRKKCAICGVEVKNMEKHHRKTHSSKASVQNPTNQRVSKKLPNGLLQNNTCPTCKTVTATHAMLCDHIATVHGRKLLREVNQMGPLQRALSQARNRGELHGPPAIAEIRRVTQIQTLTKCETCGANVKNLNEHLRKVHSSNAKCTASEHHSRVSRQIISKETLFPAGKTDALQHTMLRDHIGKIHSRQLSGKTNQLNSALPTRHQAIDLNTHHQPSANGDAKHQWGQSFRDNGQFGSYPAHDDMDDESSP